MDSGDVVIVVGLVALAVWQIRVTLRLWRNDGFERRQKIAQSQLIWFVPVVGAAVVSMALGHDEKPKQNRDGTHLRR